MTRTRTLYTAALGLAVSISLVACGPSAAPEEVTLTPVATEQPSALDRALEGDTSTSGTLDDALEEGVEAVVPVTVIGGTGEGVDVTASAAALEALRTFRDTGIQVNGIRFGSQSMPGEEVTRCIVNAPETHGPCPGSRTVIWDRSSFGEVGELSVAYAMASDIATIVAADRGVANPELSPMTACLTGVYAGVIARGDSQFTSDPESAQAALSFVLPPNPTARNAWVEDFKRGFNDSLYELPSDCGGV